MRTLTQPGPADTARIDSIGAEPVMLRVTWTAGQTLHEALAVPMAAAGFNSGCISFAGLPANPFRYVMPGPPDGPTHVAYFTAPRAPAGTTLIQHGNATFGWADGKPALHCHAAWTEPDGARRGGHILPHDTTLTAAGEALAWGFRTARIAAAPDAETNFTLFQPSGASADGAGGVVARVKPNQDITLAIEAIARAHGMPNARLLGSVGSLVGTRFADGRTVDDYATEVLIREGTVRDGTASLDLIVVDMRGHVHEGRLMRGENAVLITFDVMLEAA